MSKPIYIISYLKIDNEFEKPEFDTKILMVSTNKDEVYEQASKKYLETISEDYDINNKRTGKLYQKINNIINNSSYDWHGKYKRIHNLVSDFYDRKNKKNFYQTSGSYYNISTWLNSKKSTLFTEKEEDDDDIYDDSCSDTDTDTDSDSDTDTSFDEEDIEELDEEDEAEEEEDEQEEEDYSDYLNDMSEEEDNGDRLINSDDDNDDDSDDDSDDEGDNSDDEGDNSDDGGDNSDDEDDNSDDESNVNNKRLVEDENTNDENSNDENSDDENSNDENSGDENSNDENS